MCQEERLTSPSSSWLDGGDFGRETLFLLGKQMPQLEKGSDMFKNRLVFVLLVFISLGPRAAFAQEDRGTPEQRAACAPDAFRLCAGYIPDATNVEACLRQKKSDLSDACRAVFEHAAATASLRTIGSQRYRGAKDEE
jgi:hypothetical protein